MALIFIPDGEGSIAHFNSDVNTPNSTLIEL